MRIGRSCRLISVSSVWFCWNISAQHPHWPALLHQRGGGRGDAGVVSLPFHDINHDLSTVLFYASAGGHSCLQCVLPPLDVDKGRVSVHKTIMCAWKGVCTYLSLCWHELMTDFMSHDQTLAVQSFHSFKKRNLWLIYGLISTILNSVKAFKPINQQIKAPPNFCSHPALKRIFRLSCVEINTEKNKIWTFTTFILFTLEFGDFGVLSISNNNRAAASWRPVWWTVTTDRGWGWGGWR